MRDNDLLKDTYFDDKFKQKIIIYKAGNFTVDNIRWWAYVGINLFIYITYDLVNGKSINGSNLKIVIWQT